MLVLLCGLSAARAEDSLFDKLFARKLNPEQQAMFGPKSGALRYDSRMIRAAEIAQRRAHPQMTWRCWKYVKNALLAAEVISSRPTTLWANQAGAELSEKFGFKKLNIHNPYLAPVGAVIVYAGDDGGHVELRTASGFVSDFVSTKPYDRPLVGIYVKAS